MTDGERLSEADNPIWALLGYDGGKTTGLWMVPAQRPWRESLETALAGLAPGQSLVVAVPRPFGRSALARLSGRGSDRRKGPSPGGVAAVLEEHGMDVASTFGLWPSARSPRIAFPRSRFHVLRWLQTAGVLGGGGNRLWARVLARSPLFTPVVPLVLPGVAMVTRRGPERRET